MNISRKFSVIASLISMLAAAPAVQADHEWRLTVNGVSRHFDTDTPRSQLNEVNPGLGLEYHTSDWYIAGASYIDSYDCRAGYLGAGERWQLGQLAGITLDVGYFAGVHYRCLEYGDTQQNFVPAAFPTLTAGAFGDLVQLTAGVVPPVPDIIEDPGVAFSLSIRLPD
ncbi:hypothetical protein TspCOW1_21480 [Thiohalobacter sp. COW1]|uniref:hypothetical protein n=1 Tax=Thiohalobacter sp. COW1 TaxID=2795687 RepID=UPI0019159A2D|nr:hypothetical protein [Thiohalobacter sp. COW1]BCO32045.1 hypothetical protein TspCOW1_21480 [Thiohalobacter sp. COW1]